MKLFSNTKKNLGEALILEVFVNNAEMRGVGASLKSKFTLNMALKDQKLN